MSARQSRAGNPRHHALLAEMALRQLLARHGDMLSERETVWLSALQLSAAQGRIPTFEQVARVSQLRADIANYRKNVPSETAISDDVPEWDGAA